MSNTNAELDIIVQHNEYIIPIEVKSGGKGRLRSLHQFIDQCNHHYGVRFLGNNFSVEKTKTISGKPFVLMNLPYFLATQIHNYIEWFVNNY